MTKIIIRISNNLPPAQWLMANRHGVQNLSKETEKNDPSFDTYIYGLSLVMIFINYHNPTHLCYSYSHNNKLPLEFIKLCYNV